MSRYVLPDLPYDYGALEPHLSGKLVELHHDRHHRLYVEKANQAIDTLLEARRTDDFSHVAELSHQLAFNVSGHLLHSLYWQNLSPDGGGRPSGELALAIDRDFGSFDSFKKQLLATAMSLTGSGWAALVWDPLIHRLGTTQIHDHQSESTQSSVPLLALDAWEHAYYLQYQFEKTKYFDALWRLWNWDDVELRYRRARTLDLALGHVAENAELETPAPLHH